MCVLGVCELCVCVCCVCAMEAAKDERRQNENSSAAGSKAQGAQGQRERGTDRGREGHTGREGLSKGHSGVALFFLTLKAIKYVGQEQGGD